MSLFSLITVRYVHDWITPHDFILIQWILGTKRAETMQKFTEVKWCHIFDCNSINKLSKRSVSSKQVLCCLLSEDICIPLRNTNTSYFNTAFVFQANVGPLLIQLAFRKAAPTSVVAQPWLFILAGGGAYPRIEEIHTSSRMGRGSALEKNMQDGGEGGSTMAKTDKRQYKLVQILSHSEFISAPTLHSEWTYAIKVWPRGLRCLIKDELH